MSIRKRPDGTYFIRFYENGRKGSAMRQETLGRIPFAEAVRIYKERVALAAARRGTDDDSRVTLAMLAREYVNLHCARKSESAKVRAEQALRVILPVLGERIVRTLKPLDIEAFREKRLAAEIKPVTVNREWAVLKAILNFGEKKGVIGRNPIRRGSVPMFEAESRREVFFEPEEWERFLGAFADEVAWKSYRTRLRNLGPVKEGLQGLRRYGGGRNPDSQATAEYRERLRATVPFFRTMLYTGSRPSEVLRLTWQDIDFDRGRVSLWQEKTRAAKTVPMSKALREVLSALPRGIGGARVFVRPDGVPLTLPEVARAFRVAQKLSGIREELNPYTIRHTFASWLAIKGTPIRTIQELLGHRDLRMTLRYAHLSPAHLAEAVETIGAVEKSNRLRVGCASKESEVGETEAKPSESSGSPYENRTRISALRGPRPNR